MMYLLFVFPAKSGLTAEDFSQKKNCILINLNFVVSLTLPKDFETPFHGKFVGKYSVVTLTTSERYYIDEDGYNNLYKQLK